MSGNRIAKSASTALCLTLVMAGLASASIPKKISYQGRLLDGATGLPLAGSHEVTFRIYDAASGGDTLWTEAQTVSADSGGVISALLGSVKLIEADFSGPSWLEVEVDGEILLPRREIVSSAYAFRAMNADSVGGLPAASYSLATHNHDATYYVKPDLGTPGTINAGGNPVDWTKLKGVPAGFTDGVDDAGGLGDSHSLDAADGSPTDAVYVDNDG